MNEEFDYFLDNTDSGSDNTDNDIDSVLDPEEIEEDTQTDGEPEAIASVLSVGAYDYSYIQTTNQYLYVIAVLLTFFIVLYIFNGIRAFFQRIGG